MKQYTIIIALILLTLVEISGQQTIQNKSNQPQLPKKVKAYGDLYFGMSRDTVENILDEMSYLITIGNCDYIIYCYYNNSDKLYKLSFTQSIFLTADFYGTTLKLVHNDMYLTLKNKFGPPTSFYGFPNFLRMDNGYTKLSAIWKSKEKTIELGVGETDFTYFVNVFIYHNEMNRRVERGQDDMLEENRNNSKF